jgi:hypothetical protein
VNSVSDYVPYYASDLAGSQLCVNIYARISPPTRHSSNRERMNQLQPLQPSPNTRSPALLSFVSTHRTICPNTRSPALLSFVSTRRTICVREVLIHAQDDLCIYKHAAIQCAYRYSTDLVVGTAYNMSGIARHSNTPGPFPSGFPPAPWNGGKYVSNRNNTSWQAHMLLLENSLLAQH